MSFLLYKAKNSDSVIGYLQQTLPVQQLAEDGKTPIIVLQMVIAWAGFDPETGVVSPTPEGITSTTIESPDDLLFLGSEEEFLSNFVDDGDEDDAEETDGESVTAQ